MVFNIAIKSQNVPIKTKNGNISYEKHALNMAFAFLTYISFCRFRSGLAESGVLRMMETYPDLMKTLFLQSKIVLIASDLIDLFIPQFYPRGHIKFNRETAVLGYWRDWLLDVEGKSMFLTITAIDMRRLTYRNALMLFIYMKFT